jgi:hypothetical protein
MQSRNCIAFSAIVSGTFQPDAGFMLRPSVVLKDMLSPIWHAEKDIVSLFGSH